MSVDTSSGSNPNRRWRLRPRLVLMIVMVVSLVTLPISGYFIFQQQRSLRDAMQRKTQTMRQGLRTKGIALARNVALASERAVNEMDFLFLTSVVRSVVQHDNQVVYGIIMDGDRRAVVHSDLLQVRKVLDDASAKLAARQRTVAARYVTYKGRQVLEAIAPIEVAGERWGTIRLGLSLDQLTREITASEAHGRAQIRIGVIATIVAALIFGLLGSFVGTSAASRIVRPLQTLLKGVNLIREGHLDHRAKAEGAQEFMELGQAFNDMADAIRQRDRALRQKMDELTVALKKAEDANRLKGEFLANISHELRTPINAMVNLPVGLLEDFRKQVVWYCRVCDADFEPEAGDAQPEEGCSERCPDCGGVMRPELRLTFSGDVKDHHRLLGRIVGAGDHLLHLVNDVLDFSKLDAGEMQVFPTDIDLRTVIGSVVNALGSTGDAKGIVVHYPELAQPFQLWADPLKLSQVLINLMNNAIKFTEPGGRVELGVCSAEHEGVEHVHLTVRDTGIGIPADRLDDIFESFCQLDGGSTRAQGGTGLGLAIVRQLVALHEGRIYAESQPGAGSTFHVLLPRWAPSMRVNATRAANHRASSPSVRS